MIAKRGFTILGSEGLGDLKVTGKLKAKSIPYPSCILENLLTNISNVSLMHYTFELAN